jgi:hypothetical protein
VDVAGEAVEPRDDKLSGGDLAEVEGGREPWSIAVPAALDSMNS